MAEATRTDAAGVITCWFDGGWDAQDYARLIGAIDDAYTIAVVIDRAMRLDSEINRIGLAEGAWAEGGWAIAGSRSARLAGAQPLRLRSAGYGSPGFLGFLGILTPLRTITAAIATWRHENTERDRDQWAATLAEQREQNAQVRELLDRMEPRQRAAAAAAMLERLTGATEPIARDVRIQNLAFEELPGA